VLAIFQAVATMMMTKINVDGNNSNSSNRIIVEIRAEKVIKEEKKVAVAVEERNELVYM